MSIYGHLDYKDFVNELVSALPKGGHGEFRRMALSLRVSTTLMSQVFRGDKHLSLEMAAELCDYLLLDETESQYFLLLVEYQKAGSPNLREKLLRRIRDEQKQALSSEQKIRRHDGQELSEEDKATYYSNWMYAAIRNLSAIPDYQDAESIARKLNLPVMQVQKILLFLISRNLVLEDKGRLSYGSAWTHVPARSLYMTKHHQNWRIHAFGRMTQNEEENLFFTGPMNMSKEVADMIRAELPAFIKNITEKAAASEPEVIRCLNIDWFEF